MIIGIESSPGLSSQDLPITEPVISPPAASELGMLFCSLLLFLNSQKLRSDSLLVPAIIVLPTPDPIFAIITSIGDVQSSLSIPEAESSSPYLMVIPAGSSDPVSQSSPSPLPFFDPPPSPLHTIRVQSSSPIRESIWLVIPP